MELSTAAFTPLPVSGQLWCICTSCPEDPNLPIPGNLRPYEEPRIGAQIRWIRRSDASRGRHGKVIVKFRHYWVCRWTSPLVSWLERLPLRPRGEMEWEYCTSEGPDSSNTDVCEWSNALGMIASQYDTEGKPLSRINTSTGPEREKTLHSNCAEIERRWMAHLAEIHKEWFPDAVLNLSPGVMLIVAGYDSRLGYAPPELVRGLCSAAVQDCSPIFGYKMQEWMRCTTGIAYHSSRVDFYCRMDIEGAPGAMTTDGLGSAPEKTTDGGVSSDLVFSVSYVETVLGNSIVRTRHPTPSEWRPFSARRILDMVGLECLDLALMSAARTYNQERGSYGIDKETRMSDAVQTAPRPVSLEETTEIRFRAFLACIDEITIKSEMPLGPLHLEFVRTAALCLERGHKLFLATLASGRMTHDALYVFILAQQLLESRTRGSIRRHRVAVVCGSNRGAALSFDRFLNAAALCFGATIMRRVRRDGGCFVTMWSDNRLGESHVAFIGCGEEQMRGLSADLLICDVDSMKTSLITPFLYMSHTFVAALRSREELSSFPQAARFVVSRR